MSGMAISGNMDRYEPKSFKVGLDYGTTYSAGVYCLCSAPTPWLRSDEIEPFRGFDTDLPNESKSKSTELPSVIRYEASTVVNGPLVIKIGLDATRSLTSQGCTIRMAKLGLDDRAETAEHREKLKRDIEEVSRMGGPNTVEGIISDYLSQLFKQFKTQLEKKGYDLRDTMEFNCAVPSMWTPSSMHKMKGAIKRAMRVSNLAVNPEIRFWAEAEAATEFILSDKRTTSIEVCCLLRSPPKKSCSTWLTL